VVSISHPASRDHHVARMGVVVYGAPHDGLPGGRTADLAPGVAALDDRVLPPVSKAYSPPGAGESAFAGAAAEHPSHFLFKRPNAVASGPYHGPPSQIGSAQQHSRALETGRTLFPNPACRICTPVRGLSDEIRLLERYADLEKTAPGREDLSCASPGRWTAAPSDALLPSARVQRCSRTRFYHGVRARAPARARCWCESNAVARGWWRGASRTPRPRAEWRRSPPTGNRDRAHGSRTLASAWRSLLRPRRFGEARISKRSAGRALPGGGSESASTSTRPRGAHDEPAGRAAACARSSSRDDVRDARAPHDAEGPVPHGDIAARGRPSQRSAGGAPRLEGDRARAGERAQCPPRIEIARIGRPWRWRAISRARSAPGGGCRHRARTPNRVEGFELNASTTPEAGPTRAASPRR